MMKRKKTMKTLLYGALAISVAVPWIIIAIIKGYNDFLSLLGITCILFVYYLFIGYLLNKTN